MELPTRHGDIDMVRIDTSTHRALLDLQGYCELGMVDDALKVYKALPDEVRLNKDALELFTAFLFRHRKFVDCFFHARCGNRLYPGEVLFRAIVAHCALELNIPELLNSKGVEELRKI